MRKQKNQNQVRLLPPEVYEQGLLDLANAITLVWVCGSIVIIGFAFFKMWWP
jgi:hypothetical protein